MSEEAVNNSWVKTILLALFLLALLMWMSGSNPPTGWDSNTTPTATVAPTPEFTYYCKQCKHSRLWHRDQTWECQMPPYCACAVFKH